MVTIGRRIQAWREASGLSIGELAAAVGVTWPAVRQWEKGWSNPTAANIEKVAAACGADMPKFWGRMPRARRSA